MEKLGFGLDDDSGTCDQKQTNPQELRRLSIQRCIQSLVHACQCRDANCRLPNCQKMKKVVPHAKSCKRKTNGGCPVCEQLIALCCYHVKHCQEAKCPVPFCLNIKHKLRQQQFQQRLQQAQILKRCLAMMQNRGMSGAVPHMVAASVNYGKGNPVVSPPTPNPALMAQQQQQMQAQIMKPMSQMMPSGPNSMLQGMGGCWDGAPHSYGQQNMQQGQPHQMPQPQPSQLMGGPAGMGNTMAPPQGLPNPGPNMGSMQRPTQALQQLLHTLKSPTSPQQQQQVLQILKSNPQLMAAFIKQRTAQRQQQQQQMLLNDSNMIPPQSSVWYQKQQQHHLLAMQRQQQQQQQQNQFPQPQPPLYAQRQRIPLPMGFGHQPGFEGDGSQQFQFQQQQIMLQIQQQMASPTHPPVSPQQQGLLGHPQGSPVPSPQQQPMRSPPPTAGTGGAVSAAHRLAPDSDATHTVSAATARSLTTLTSPDSLAPP